MLTRWRSRSCVLALPWCLFASLASADTWQIAAENRDARDDGGGGSTNACWVGDTGFADACGLQWAATIPNGATILSAHVRIYNTVQNGSGNPYTTRIHVEDTNSAVAFTGAGNDIYGRTYWGTTVDWDMPLPVGVYTMSPDISALIQHIVDRPGWAPGNFINVAIWGVTAAAVSGTAGVMGDFPSNVAELVVNWVPADTLYRSVGINGADLNTGAATVEISGSTATFSLAMGADVGVGDVLTYNSGGARLAFIHGRTSSTEFTVRDKDGAVPTATALGTPVGVYRAYTSLSNWVAGTQNPNIVEPVVGDVNAPTDLIAANLVMMIACYDDGPMDDTVIIDGFVTGPNNDLHIFTPTSANQVGTSQRHTGVAGTGFRLAPVTATPPNAMQIIEVQDDHVGITGIEIDGTGITNGRSIDGVEVDSTVSLAGQVALDTLLIHDITSQDGTGADADTNAVNAQSGNVTVKNSIIYDLLETTDLFNAHAQAIRLQSTGTHYVHHNTIFNIKNTGAGTGEAQGIVRVGGTVTARNNVALDIDSVNGAEECFLGTITQANNVSSDATAVGVTNQTAYASYFVSVANGGEDLHLRSDSSALWGSYGTPLASDPNLPVPVDVDAESRDTANPDIGADEFSSSGPPMLVESGTYAGDGSAGRSIYVGFQPDAVFVKRVGIVPDVNAVLRTSSMTGDNTKSLDNAGVALAANLVQSLDANGFTVGSDVAVNESGQTYHWVAFRSAAQGMHVGSYSGDPAATQQIAGVGFQPEYLIVMPAIAGDPNGMPVSTSSTLPSNASFDFDATERSPDSIRALQADGFEVGSGGVGRPDLNADGVTFHYVAWNAVPGQMAVGTYSGDGADDRDLDVVGFFPEWVLVKKYPDGAAERAWTMKPASTGTSVDIGLRFSEIATITNTIQSLRSLGFQVGSDERVNSSTACGGVCTYHWVAFGPHTAETNYRSIGMAADYVTGTITATAGSTMVMGTGTTWVSANRGRGDRIDINGTDYTIASVDSETELTLTSPTPAPYAGAYTISRQYSTLAAWEDCIDGPGGAACSYFPVTSSSLVADDRNEIGIAYNDSAVPADPDFTIGVTIDGSITDADHRITLTAAVTNLHRGIAGQGVLVDHGANPNDIISIQDNFVTLEWLELANGGASADGVNVSGQGSSNYVVLRNMLIHDVNSSGVELQSSGLVADIYNNIIYDVPSRGLAIAVATPSTLRIVNNTIYNSGFAGLQAVPPGSYPTVLLRNNIVHTSGGPGDFDVNGEDPASSHNLASDGTATAHSPAGGGLDSIPRASVPFVSTAPGLEDLHIQSGGAAENAGADLSAILGFDIDGGARQTPWDIGADDVQATTEVELMSFTGRGMDGAVAITWETATELDNVGFHLYRAASINGPFARITARMIPGLGTSPAGASYRYVDGGLANGTTYFYELEDIDISGRTERHGPLSATPQGGAIETERSNPRITYGEPEANGLRIVKRTDREVILELVTRGFYAEPVEDGSVDVSIPEFVESEEASVPVRRFWLELPFDREVARVRVDEREVERFSGLTPAGLSPELVAERDGSVRATRRRRRARGQLMPEQAGRVVSQGFQGREHKVLLELAPVRWNGELVLSQRLVVRVVLGKRRIANQRRHRQAGISRLVTEEAGLYAVRYRGRRVRLTRHGEDVPYHREGQTLYFIADGDAVYELSSEPGKLMATVDGTPSGPVHTSYWHTESREENRYYQAALVHAPDIWLWDYLLAPMEKSFTFDVAAPASLEGGTLRVWLQGTSEASHHVRFHVNGSFVGEAQWDGRHDRLFEAETWLREGTNELTLESVGASYSMVMLDRFDVVYARRGVGELEGAWETGTAEVSGLETAHVVEIGDDGPRWVRDLGWSENRVRFRAESTKRYLVAARARTPRIVPVRPSRLLATTRWAEWLIIGPRELLGEAAPLVEHRRADGLRAQGVSLESIYNDFGHGEERPEAIREYLRALYQQAGSLKYVVLLGDGTFDSEDYLGTGVRNQVPPLMVKTSYLWTASDPAYAAVNGDDALPDLAIGRLPAASAGEARTMVQKILAYERGDTRLVDGRVVLVADNPDGAGDFVTDADALASRLLAGKRTSKLYLPHAATADVVRAFDDGASMMSYLGHGGIHLWAEESLFQTSDVGSLSAQAEQPLVLTMNCLNGYFHFPHFDSLAEALVKAEDKGAIAAFSPSGLSLNGPAKLYQEALVDELVNGEHARLGDAILEAQRRYAETGALPELLSIYHLFGDPAVALR